MMTRITVDPDRMRETRDALTNATEDLQGELDALAHELTWLEGSWSGDAFDAYREAQSRWSDSMSEVRTFMTDITTMFSEVIVRYEDAEANIVREAG